MAITSICGLMFKLVYVNLDNKICAKFEFIRKIILVTLLREEFLKKTFNFSIMFEFL